jgi:uncharacterized protein
VRLIISEIPEEGLDQELDLPVKLNNSLTADIAHVVLKIFRLKKMVLIEGTINIDISLKCSRCCGDFVLPLQNITFSDELNPAQEMSQEDEQELTNEEMDLSYYANDEIDLQELIKEQVMLSVPMKPVCSENCKGMCAACGKDLNAGLCECKEDVHDPRLAPLQQLKEAMKNKKPS